MKLLEVVPAYTNRMTVTADQYGMRVTFGLEGRDEQEQDGIEYHTAIYLGPDGAEALLKVLTHVLAQHKEAMAKQQNAPTSQGQN